jgi:GntR family transcriptional regulator / MocR family aminotransferase
LTVVTRANSESRDLHLELGTAIAPGTRGARELLVTALRDAVRSGRLATGSVLPPSRSLATDLGLARNTVAEAYADLVAEGWLASRQGSGTWVVNTRDIRSPSRPRGTPGQPLHDLMPGTPDVSAFPRTAWLASTRRALMAAPTEALRPGDPRGRPELREALTEYLGRARGVRTSPDAVVICAGTRNAVELLARVFATDARYKTATQPGPIAVEAYGLHIFREAIAAMGIETTPIRCDERGACVDQLEDTDAPAALLTPAHFFPHGVPLHSSRRSALIEWSRRTSGYVLEDDYDGEFRYDRQPIGAVQGLDPQRVCYLGSASKSLSPALRLGWMALPNDLVEPVIDAAGGQQFYVNAIDQLTMADFISTGQYDKHIRRMRNSYRRRRITLVERLSPFDVRISGLSAGLHLLLLLPDGTEHEALRRAGEAGIALSGLSRMRHPLAGPDVPDEDGIVVNFGAPADHAFGAAIDALCEVLAELS